MLIRMSQSDKTPSFSPAPTLLITPHLKVMKRLSLVLIGSFWSDCFSPSNLCLSLVLLVLEQEVVSISSSSPLYKHLKTGPRIPQNVPQNH